MPELPEVETVMRGLQPFMEGRRMTRVEQRRPDLRWPLPADFVARLEGKRVDHMTRRAKYILVHMDDGTVLLWHLGMSGKVNIDAVRPAELEKHDHIVFTMEDGTVIRFNDHRRFGAMDLISGPALAGHKLIAALGPEPLSNAFNGPALAAALKGKRTPIKAALLDQKVVAGLGNIYVSEALFRSGISPLRQAANVQGVRAERLAGAIRQVLEDAIRAGGSTLRDHQRPDGELGYFQHSFQVYDREGVPCPVDAAHGPIRRIVQSGRSTFYCPRCQR
ncbi:bifunctional DNA-formamidopyrimidine glycosylase/DNA-(apurinic or apyrimidinic site) lyase [Nisaea acidiphila]|uniref:Formamidopyrimidine-DNA glycosylase n=1 Tax=Nisaea acidiphila TaxID=1862145 RepID=A0A9J7B372_9PROT|nr:bifunctional DNA-formamidopyrimidine glycosylase/DNA-(apurinic or apyrimidinic site) lyase [Nisaea acidiphila]UUX52093.1 bifunctional DNA-formamidopyrimidine glycosylase/DNA-(apurinic or apyrimidinic site) lyase [Nisaea acidiphila]